MQELKAYFGLIDNGKPKADETIVVSGVAGVVAGQIVKIHSFAVIDIAGADVKIKLLKGNSKTLFLVASSLSFSC